MAAYRIVIVMAVIGLCVPACGVHVTSDTVNVKHTIGFDVEGISNYCMKVCGGEEVCYRDCFNRFAELFTDPQICVDLNTCPR